VDDSAPSPRRVRADSAPSPRRVRAESAKRQRQPRAGPPLSMALPVKTRSEPLARCERSDRAGKVTWILRSSSGFRPIAPCCLGLFWLEIAFDRRRCRFDRGLCATMRDYARCFRIVRLRVDECLSVAMVCQAVEGRSLARRSGDAVFVPTAPRLTHGIQGRPCRNCPISSSIHPTSSAV
jgi:hypothetical protein